MVQGGCQFTLGITFIDCPVYGDKDHIRVWCRVLRQTEQLHIMLDEMQKRKLPAQATCHFNLCVIGGGSLFSSNLFRTDSSVVGQYIHVCTCTSANVHIRINLVHEKTLTESEIIQH